MTQSSPIITSCSKIELAPIIVFLPIFTFFPIKTLLLNLTDLNLPLIGFFNDKSG